MEWGARRLNSSNTPRTSHLDQDCEPSLRALSALGSMRSRPCHHRAEVHLWRFRSLRHESMSAHHESMIGLRSNSRPTSKHAKRFAGEMMISSMASSITVEIVRMSSPSHRKPHLVVIYVVASEQRVVIGGVPHRIDSMSVIGKPSKDDAKTERSAPQKTCSILSIRPMKRILVA